MTLAISALSDAFRNRDLAAALDCFAEDPETIYAGSEQAEVAVGPEALRELFRRIFDRDEAYSWVTRQAWSSARGELLVVLAELTLTVHPDSGDTSDVPYRLSGVLRIEGNESRWLLCHGAEPST
jgi:ketosteroid isomerase-like protein